MRKPLALGLFLLWTFRLAAQLPAGSTAPDFTTTDINGQVWHLYELLDQGKIVVIEISATWCTPCWAYHNGHALHKFYAEHGPEGDNKARVLFIEGDPTTNVQCLYGPSGCNDNSLGNWVAGTPFPIINDDAIADAYAITYFPTIFVICPNRKVHEVGQLNAENLWEEASACPVAFGTRNAGLFNYTTGSAFKEVCGTVQLQPSFRMINLGTDTLKQASIELRWNDLSMQTIHWSGYLPLYEEVLLAFDSLPVITSGTLQTAITEVNNTPADDDTTNNIRSDQFVDAAEFHTQKILLKIKTDQFGAETYWELHDEQGMVLDFGGNQAVGPNGGGMLTGIPGGPGAYNDESIVKDTLQLPGPGCYSIHFVDAYGDGICCTYGNGYYKLYNLDDPVLPILQGGNFRAYDRRVFSLASITATGTISPFISDLLLYPNPASDQLDVDFGLAQGMRIGVTIVNMLGQIVQTHTPETLAPGEYQWQLPVATLSNGLYRVQLQAGDRVLTQTFLIQR